MPTLLELSGIEAKAPMQGESLVPFLRGDTSPLNFENRPLLAATHLGPVPKFSLVQNSWKLNADPSKGKLVLFDLSKDPWEFEDIAGCKPNIARSMLQRLVKIQTQLPAYEGQVTTRHEISQEQIDRLKALGYLQ